MIAGILGTLGWIVLILVGVGAVLGFTLANGRRRGGGGS